MVAAFATIKYAPVIPNKGNSCYMGKCWNSSLVDTLPMSTELFNFQNSH